MFLQYWTETTSTLTDVESYEYRFRIPSRSSYTEIAGTESGLGQQGEINEININEIKVFFAGSFKEI